MKVLHNDITPSNILGSDLDFSTLKLIDIDVSLVYHSDDSIYYAPETIKKETDT